MKTLFFTMNLLLAGIIIFVSCQKNDSLNKIAKPCPECTDHTQTPFNGISTSTAAMMSASYKILNQPKLIIDEVIPDANSIWFSAESLKNFIWKVEQEVCRKGCAEKLKLGMRIYYARYPNPAGMSSNNDLNTLDPDFQQHHTLFIVPTYQDVNDPKVHHDFDPWHWGENGCAPKTMAQWFAGPTGTRPFGLEKSLIFSINEPQYFKSAGGGLTPAMNHGGLIPPFTDDGTGY